MSVNATAPNTCCRSQVYPADWVRALNSASDGKLMPASCAFHCPRRPPSDVALSKLIANIRPLDLTTRRTSRSASLIEQNSFSEPPHSNASTDASAKGRRWAGARMCAIFFTPSQRACARLSAFPLPYQWRQCSPLCHLAPIWQRRARTSRWRSRDREPIRAAGLGANRSAISILARPGSFLPIGV